LTLANIIGLGLPTIDEDDDEENGFFLNGNSDMDLLAKKRSW